MDFKIETSQNEDGKNVWDLAIRNGDIATVSGEKEADQMANIASTFELNSVPLVDGRGVDWLGLLFKEKSLMEIDTEIRQSLSTYLDDVSYTPIYTREGDALQVQITRINLNTGVVQ